MKKATACPEEVRMVFSFMKFMGQKHIAFAV
jgi:hypothetical protein